MIELLNRSSGKVFAMSVSGKLLHQDGGHFRSCTLLYSKADVLPSLNRSVLGRCLKGRRKLASSCPKTVHLLRKVLIFLWPVLGRSNMLTTY